jgi:hypothetical protein
MEKNENRPKGNLKKSKILVYLHIFMFQSSLYIIVGTDSDILGF